jgi:hypothetical protein
MQMPEGENGGLDCLTDLRRYTLNAKPIINKGEVSARHHLLLVSNGVILNLQA